MPPQIQQQKEEADLLLIKARAAMADADRRAEVSSGKISKRMMYQPLPNKNYWITPPPFFFFLIDRLRRFYSS